MRLKMSERICIRTNVKRHTQTHNTHIKYVKIAINNDRLKHFNVDSVAICQIKLEYLRWNKIEWLALLGMQIVVRFCFFLFHWSIFGCDLNSGTVASQLDICGKSNGIQVIFRGDYLMLDAIIRYYVHILRAFGSCCYSLPHFVWFIAIGSLLYVCVCVSVLSFHLSHL